MKEAKNSGYHQVTEPGTCVKCRFFFVDYLEALFDITNYVNVYCLERQVDCFYNAG